MHKSVKWEPSKAAWTPEETEPLPAPETSYVIEPSAALKFYPYFEVSPCKGFDAYYIQLHTSEDNVYVEFVSAAAVKNDGFETALAWGLHRLAVQLLEGGNF